MKLIVADPGHFHATLLQKEMYPGLDSRVSVYAPLGAEAIEYLSRIARFNARAENPTNWELNVHLSAQPMDELVRNELRAAGEIVVFAGRNRGKIDRILQALEAGFHVLADKPWIIESQDLPKLERALTIAAERGLTAYDIMTERYEVTSELQREFVSDKDVFGELETGSAAEPAISLFSAHHIMKTVAGVPLRRPAWFFDVEEQGEGLSDVGTHLVDLAQWTAFPDEAIDAASDIQIVQGRRWPIALSVSQLETVTGEARFPHNFDYWCNNAVDYTLRGVHVRIEAVWNWEAPPGTGDVYTAVFRGRKARVELRQGAAEDYRPELYIVPAAGRKEVFAAARRRIARLQTRWPGLHAMEADGELRLNIPDGFRVGHEAHFAQVANRFYVRAPGSMPAWERACMIAKYLVSTKGVEAGRP